MPADTRSAATARKPVQGGERDHLRSARHVVESEPRRGVPTRWVSLLWRIGAAVRAAHSSSVPF